MSAFATDVALELATAKAKHPPINSAHEGYAVILEELHEFWLEVMKRKSQRDPKAMKLELIQVAAMAQRTAEDLRLV